MRMTLHFVIAVIIVSLQISLPSEARSLLQHKPERNWVVLVAGSCGWENYRHQADLAHAYSVIRSHGVPKEQIIVMMCDDIANNSMNPFPGKMFNNYSHVDVYENLQIDYRAEDVTPSNFIALMQGDRELKKKGYKVLESDQNSHVFVFFTDHGAPGLIAFPEDNLYASQLQDVFFWLHSRRKFDQLVMYVEACFSGSMFVDTLPRGAKIYATTAANGQESSYACYCNDPEIYTCLGDTYSVNWIHDTETHALGQRSLEQQFEAVRYWTNSSHVEKFGDLLMQDEKLDEFEGEEGEDQYGFQSQAKQSESPPDQVSSSWAHWVPVYKALEASGSKRAFDNVVDKLRLHQFKEQFVDHIFKHILEGLLAAHAETGGDTLPIWKNFLVTAKTPLDQQNRYCYEQAVSQLTKHCFTIQEYPFVAQKLQTFVNLCALPIDADLIEKTILDICTADVEKYM